MAVVYRKGYADRIASFIDSLNGLFSVGRVHYQLAVGKFHRITV